MQPIFIFSLPRSGSTLLQRILATHNNIATASEPWLLLPFLYSLKKEGAKAEYDHAVGVQALQDFIAELPAGRQDFDMVLREFAIKLYQKAASKKGVIYFLDKTPRYSLVAEEVINLFPDGKFIFLWRNPLAVIASMIETWCAGQWKIYRFHSDLNYAMHRMISAYKAYKENVCSVRYEDIVAEGEAAFMEMFEYLEMTAPVDITTAFSKIKLNGRMGDPTGVKQYDALSQLSIQKWKNALRSPIRKEWCRNFLLGIGKDDLNMMGYDLHDLLQELDEIPTSFNTILSDVYFSMSGSIKNMLKRRINGFC
ncbi:sulfotransferase [Sinimarinibacterium sp. CAU 1509]|uniref:sulfotransferase family protein n=1 Tax=Sinimarinibacterium sp. CAU 1509 TaxID=2562283 RepID=UPI0010AB92E6|nr:sulfotransferase [Sinimarinibacterium sp. CAU 1509]TJY61952.1 sulfotransferase [Sinimarinibacterium sp. CAU 1509]